MASMGALGFLVLAMVFSVSSRVYGLSVDYYEKSCPRLEDAVRNAVKKAMLNDRTVPAALLRMHFHDCFIRVFTFFCLFFFWPPKKINYI